jgi:hypothetical protein
LALRPGEFGFAARNRPASNGQAVESKTSNAGTARLALMVSNA